MSAEPWRLQIMADGSLEPLPLYARVPNNVIVVDTWQRHPYIHLVNLMNTQTSQPFILPISPKASNQDFRTQVAAVLGCDINELIMVDAHGASWTYPTV